MWKTLRGGLFGIFGVMTYLVGPFLLYLAYLLASGYRVTLFAGKVALMSVLCAGVPVIFSNVSLNDANPWQIIKMLFARGQTNFWEGGVWGAPVGGTLLALFGRPASNVIMLLVFLLGLMFFFAITPADVVLFVNNQYQKLQQARQDRAEEETAYDTQLFAQEQEEEPIENLTAPAQDNRPHHPAYDVIADTGRIPVQPAQPVQPLVQQAAPVNQPAQPVQSAVPSQPAASAPVIPITPRHLLTLPMPPQPGTPRPAMVRLLPSHSPVLPLTWTSAPKRPLLPPKPPLSTIRWSLSTSAPAAPSAWTRCPIFLTLRTITLPRPSSSPLSSLLQTSLS